jgi:hypothetical protein
MGSRISDHSGKKMNTRKRLRQTQAVGLARMSARKLLLCLDKSTVLDRLAPQMVKCIKV